MFLFSSESGIVKKHLRFGWVFDMVADFSTDLANAMKTRLHQKFVTWSRKLNGQQSAIPFCVTDDCSDMTITLTNNNNDYRITIDIDGVA